jgi:hypothetical protein
MTAEELAAEQATADVVAALAVELATRPLTREQQAMADKAARIMRRLDHLEKNRREGRI